MAGCDGASSRAVTSEATRAAPRGTLPPPTLSASEAPMIVIYEDRWASRILPPGTPRQQLEAAVWHDGRMVWHADGSLRTGQIEVKKIDVLLQRLHRDGAFDNGKVSESNYGLDSGFDVIRVRLADRELHFQSWHDRFEQNPGLVVSSRGVESLDGRTRESVLSSDKPEYLRFRHTWADVRSTVRSWIPAEGAAFEGSDFAGVVGEPVGA